MKDLKLTKAEIAHLYLLLHYNEAEGTCWGNAEHWWKHHESIKEKILELVKVGTNK